MQRPSLADACGYAGLIGEEVEGLLSSEPFAMTWGKVFRVQCHQLTYARRPAALRSLRGVLSTSTSEETERGDRVFTPVIK